MKSKQRLTQMLGFIAFSPTYGLCGLLITFLLIGCGTENMTLEEAKNQKYAVRVENINFDVPLLYHPHESEHENGWIPPNPERETIDTIRIAALLPDMDYYNEKTANEFKVKGHGKKVHILMTHYRVNWEYYFTNAYQRLTKLPEHPLVPGMFHYQDPMSDMDDIFLSHDKPVRDLTKIICDNSPSDPHPSPSPSCQVTTIYRNQFQLEYYFSLQFLEQWRGIDGKVKALLDSFIPSKTAL